MSFNQQSSRAGFKTHARTEGKREREGEGEEASASFFISYCIHMIWGCFVSFLGTVPEFLSRAIRTIQKTAPVPIVGPERYPCLNLKMVCSDSMYM